MLEFLRSFILEVQADPLGSDTRKYIIKGKLSIIEWS